MNKLLVTSEFNDDVNDNKTVLMAVCWNKGSISLTYFLLSQDLFLILAK